MMAVDRDTAAERMARARQEFTEALARGVSIPELREAKKRERRVEHRRFMDRLNGVSERPAPWMMRD